MKKIAEIVTTFTTIVLWIIFAVGWTSVGIEWLIPESMPLLIRIFSGVAIFGVSVVVGFFTMALIMWINEQLTN